MTKDNKRGMINFTIIITFLLFILAIYTINNMRNAKPIDQSDIVTIQYNDTVYPYYGNISYFGYVFASKHEIKHFEITSLEGDKDVEDNLSVNFKEYFDYGTKSTKYKDMYLYVVEFRIKSSKPIKLDNINVNLNWKSQITLPVNIVLEEIDSIYDYSVMTYFERSDNVHDKEKFILELISNYNVKIKDVILKSSLFEADKVYLNHKELTGDEPFDMDMNKRTHLRIDFKNAPIDNVKQAERLYIKIIYERNGKECEYNSDWFWVGNYDDLLYDKIDKIKLN